MIPQSVKQPKPEKLAKGRIHLLTGMAPSEPLRMTKAGDSFRQYMAGIRNEALNSGDDYIASIVGSVIRSGRISKKQAYVITLWQINQGYNN
jgi:hypothetical protein